MLPLLSQSSRRRLHPAVKAGQLERTSLRLQGFSVEDARSLDHLLQLETVVQRRLEEGNMTTRRSKKPAPNQSEGNAREEIGDG